MGKDRDIHYDILIPVLVQDLLLRGGKPRLGIANRGQCLDSI